MIDFYSEKEIKIAVACPSYKRPFCRTAHFISDTNIYIDKSEYEAYKEANGEYGNIVCCDDGIQGNLPRVRNYILDTEFNNGADIVVMMDDDVTGIDYYKPNVKTNFGYEKHKVTEKDFYDFIMFGSVLCQEWGLGMWGISYNADKMNYHHYSPFATLKSAIGQFMVFVKDELRFDERLPLKEDYDMNIQQINKYRGVLSINFFHVNADYGKMAGGTSIRRNDKREFEQFCLFKKKWGSNIVTGTNTRGGIAKKKSRNNKGVRKEFVSKYDFSHPIVKVPIKGV